LGECEKPKFGEVFAVHPAEVPVARLVRIMTAKCEKRAFRIIVWASRTVGWLLLALSIISFLEISLSGSLRLASSIALGLVAIVWIVGLELFLRFFDKFLSRN
jgi:hypothetical protein